MNPTSLALELTHPVRLVCLAAVPVLLYYFYRSLVDFPRWQRSVSLAVRTVIVVLLVLALAGLTLLRPTTEQFVVLAVDRSTSVGEESTHAAAAFLDEALAKAEGNKFAILPFAKEPGQLTLTRSVSEGSGTQARSVSEGHTQARSASEGNASSTIEQPNAAHQGTNIEAALEAAIASLPPGYVPGIVLLSDGNETLGDGLKASLKAGLPISTVPLATRNEPEVQVAGVTLPAQVRQGEPFYVEVAINSNHDDEGIVTVYRGAHEVV